MIKSVATYAGCLPLRAAPPFSKIHAPRHARQRAIRRHAYARHGIAARLYGMRVQTAQRTAEAAGNSTAVSSRRQATRHAAAVSLRIKDARCRAARRTRARACAAAMAMARQQKRHIALRARVGDRCCRDVLTTMYATAVGTAAMAHAGRIMPYAPPCRQNIDIMLPTPLRHMRAQTAKIIYATFLRPDPPACVHATLRARAAPRAAAFVRRHQTLLLLFAAEARRHTAPLRIRCRFVCRRWCAAATAPPLQHAHKECTHANSRAIAVHTRRRAASYMLASPPRVVMS